jgi:hypothetical protein
LFYITYKVKKEESYTKTGFFSMIVLFSGVYLSIYILFITSDLVLNPTAPESVAAITLYHQAAP